MDKVEFSQQARANESNRKNRYLTKLYATV